MKLNVLAAFFFTSLLLANFFVVSSTAPVPAPAPAPGFCDGKCKGRCAKAGVKDRCLAYCKICCDKCGCVPSGTYGNKHECACYQNLKNSKGNSKCP